MAEKKVEIGVGMDIDTMSVDQLNQALEKVKKSAQDISATDFKTSQKSLEALKQQADLYDRMIEKQKTFIGQRTTQAQQQMIPGAVAGVRVSQIFEQFRKAGLEPPEGEEVGRMAREQIVGQRMGAMGVPQVQRQVQQAEAQRQNIMEQIKQIESGQQAQGRGGGVIPGAVRAAGVGMGAGMALIGAGGVVASMVQGARWANELESTTIRLRALTQEVGINIGDWAKGTAMARVEAIRYAEQTMRAFGGGEQAFIPGMERRLGFGQGELVPFFPMFRMAGLEDQGGISGLLRRGLTEARRVGRPHDILGMMQGLTMSTDVLGRTLITPSAPGTLATLNMVRNTFGETMSPERATRIMMNMNQAITADEPQRRAFMLRSVGFAGGGLEEYQRSVMEIEKGISDPTLVRRMLQRAETETGSRAGMIQLMSGMGMSMTQSSRLVDRYLTGETFTNDQINEMMMGVTDEKVKAEKEFVGSVTTLDTAMKSFKDMVTSFGKTSLTLAEPFLDWGSKWMNRLDHWADRLDSFLGRQDITTGEKIFGTTPRLMFQTGKMKGETFSERLIESIDKLTAYTKREEGEVPDWLKKEREAAAEFRKLYKQGGIRDVGREALLFGERGLRAAAPGGDPLEIERIWGRKKFFERFEEDVPGRQTILVYGGGTRTMQINVPDHAVADVAKIVKEAVTGTSREEREVTMEELAQIKTVLEKYKVKPVFRGEWEGKLR